MMLLWILIALVYFLNNLIMALGYSLDINHKPYVVVILLLFGFPILIISLIWRT